MKQLACIALVLFAAACGHHDKTCSSFQAAHVEMLRVDDGSPTMQRLYQHVVADKGSEITAAIDTWRPESAASTHTDYYLEGPSKPAIEKYVASLSPELAIPSSEKLVYEHVQPPTGSPYWRTYLVGARVLLDQTSIANVHASTSESLPTVTIDFTKAGSETFAKVTESAVGHKIATVVDGEVISAPVVNGVIRGGKAMITFASPSDAAEFLKTAGC